MIQELFVIVDVKANAASLDLGIIPAQNADLVKRGIASLLMQGKLPTQMMQFPDDFYLYRIGAFETVDLELAVKKERICCLADLINGGKTDA